MKTIELKNALPLSVFSHEMIKNNSSTDDDLEAKKDMEYFLEELQTILKTIDNNQLNDKEAEEIYEKINFMLEMHEAEHLDN